MLAAVVEFTINAFIPQLYLLSALGNFIMEWFGEG
jgi:hypothetical protein